IRLLASLGWLPWAVSRPDRLGHKVILGHLGLKGRRDRKVILGRLDLKGLRVLKVHRVLKGHKDLLGLPGLLAHLDHKVRKDLLDRPGRRDRKALPGHKGLLELGCLSLPSSRRLWATGH